MKHNTNEFRRVCDDCPLRTEVDTLRASVSWSRGDEGDVATLYDGENCHSIRIATEIDDNSPLQVTQQDVGERISRCTGPKTNLLRSRCGAGLGRAWRWDAVHGVYKPTLSSPEEIIPLMQDANYRDAMPRYEESVWLIGDPRDHSELRCPDASAFRNYHIVKLSETIRGTTAEIKQGKAVMLDRIVLSLGIEGMEDVFRIRIAHGGPDFAFHSNKDLDGKNPAEKKDKIRRILAEGIYAYLFSDLKTIEESERLISVADSEARKRSDAVTSYLVNGGLRKALEEERDRKKNRIKISNE